MSSHFATLRFERAIGAPAVTVWQAWTSPEARALWSPPSPEAQVEFLKAETGVGGREVSICRVPGHPDIRCEVLWLDLQSGTRGVNSETVQSEGVTKSVALVTTDLVAQGEGTRLVVTAQLSASDSTMEAGYREGFTVGLDSLVGLAERTMVLERVIRAPRKMVSGAWLSPEALPQWWGPDGFSCQTKRIDLRTGGDWVFDMIGPDGTVFPNHHRYGEMREDRIAYTLHWGENGPKHADGWATFEDIGGATRVTLSMVFGTAEEFKAAKGFGAPELGLQTLGKLARFVGAD